MSKKTGFLKAAAVTLALMACCGAFAGCGPKQVPNSETDLQIHYWRSGLGLDFMDEIIADFKEAYPQYNVIYDFSSSGVFGTTIGTGAEYNSIDLYLFSSTGMDANAVNYLEPLDDILSEKSNESDALTIGERIIPSVWDGFKDQDGHYYTMPHTNTYTGIVYNADMIGNEKYPLPRTTEELWDLVSRISNDDELPYPFIHFTDFNGGYWNCPAVVWEAQYEGRDTYIEEIVVGQETAPNGEKYPSKERLTSCDGIRETIEVFRNIINDKTCAPGSNSESYTNAQTRFLDGEAVMMANGSWLLNEMKGTGLAPNIKMMKMPVISAIIEHPDIKNVTGEDGIADDYELAALIDAIDAVTDLDASKVPLSGEGYQVSAAIRDRVFEARNLIANTSTDNAFAIPNYSTAKEAAKDFIKFYYSDQCINTFAEYVNIQLPIAFGDGSTDIDMTGWSDFNREIAAFTSQRIAVTEIPACTSSLYTVGNAWESFGKTATFVKEFAGPNNTTSAKSVWDNIEETINTKFDNIYMSDAGLI